VRQHDRTDQPGAGHGEHRAAACMPPSTATTPRLHASALAVAVRSLTGRRAAGRQRSARSRRRVCISFARTMGCQAALPPPATGLRAPFDGFQLPWRVHSGLAVRWAQRPTGRARVSHVAASPGRPANRGYDRAGRAHRAAARRLGAAVSVSLVPPQGAHRKFFGSVGFCEAIFAIPAADQLGRSGCCVRPAAGAARLRSGAP